MFIAFIIVCASTISQEIDTDTCLRMDDAWGPYITIENCQIRSNQMKDEVLYGIMNEYTFDMMGNPELIYVEPFCEFEDLGPAV